MSKDYSDRPGFDHEDGFCKKCSAGHAKTVNLPDGRSFIGCTNYPTCNNTELLRKPIDPVGLLSGDDVLECWAGAMLYDKEY